MIIRYIENMPKRLFVIGDIHGCVEELCYMLEYLMSEQKLNQNDIVVFVGDYIDRGDNSKEVIQCLIEFKEKFTNTVFLKGNHEDMLLSYITSNRIGIRDSYLANGGVKTLESYNKPFEGEGYTWEEEQNIIEQHLDFFCSLESAIIIGDYIIVHAGVNPLLPLDYQVEDDLLWIREDFICNTHPFDKTVVFGHTPYHNIFFDLPYKIGIDTGLVYGNKLSCVELVNKKVFQIDRGDIFVASTTFEALLKQEKEGVRTDEQIEDHENTTKVS